MSQFKTCVPILLVDNVVERQKIGKEDQDQVRFPITITVLYVK